MSQRQRRSPKYERALAELQTRIEAGSFPYRSFLPPERELAEDLGINRQTLRKILVTLNEYHLIEHEAGRGHRVVYMLLKPEVTSREKIATIFYRPADYLQIDGYYGPIFSSLAKEAELNHDWLTQLLSARRPIEEIASLIKSENIQGLITLGIMDTQTLTALKSLEVPIVSIDYDAESLGIDSIVENDFNSAYQASQLLTQLGHQHIGYIGMIRGSDHVGFEEEASSALRQQGYLKALEDAGLSNHYTSIGPSGIGGGIKGFNELYEQNPQITALFCFQDQMAVGAMRAARDKGLRVPEDFSIIGYGNDTQINNILELPLTTVRGGSHHNIAITAINLLRKRMRKPEHPAQKTVLDGELIVRQSTAKCPR